MNKNVYPNINHDPVLRKQFEAEFQRGVQSVTPEWQEGEPKKAGYYLATVEPDGGARFVSELWFNPTGGGGVKWWKSRGYLGDQSDGMRPAMKHPVVAWMPMPKPAEI